MNFKIFSVLLASLVLLGVFVFAQTPLNNPPPIIVNANSCTENDGGLNYLTSGIITGTFWWLGPNNTNITYTGGLADTCISNTILLEGVCGSSINYTGLAGALYVDCAAPNPSYGCVAGRCVLLNTTAGNNTGGGSNNTNTTNSTGGSNSTNVTLPNLIVSNITRISFNATTTNGTNGSNGTTTYTVNVTTWVKNIGSGNANPSITSNKFGFSSPILMATPAIPAGQTRLVSRLVFGVLPGTYSTLSHADNTSVIAETSESDNYGFANLIVP